MNGCQRRNSNSFSKPPGNLWTVLSHFNPHLSSSHCLHFHTLFLSEMDSKVKTSTTSVIPFHPPSPSSNPRRTMMAVVVSSLVVSPLNHGIDRVQIVMGIRKMPQPSFSPSPILTPSLQQNIQSNLTMNFKSTILVIIVLHLVVGMIFMFLLILTTTLIHTPTFHIPTMTQLAKVTILSLEQRISQQVKLKYILWFKKYLYEYSSFLVPLK